MNDVGVVYRRLMGEARALGALVARIRLDQLAVTGDPEQRRHIDRAVDALEVGGLEDLTAERRAAITASAITGLKQILELMEAPERSGGWTHDDPALLQAQGKASADIAESIRSAGIGKPDARILDIGCGVAHLSLAFCASFPQSTVVGIDPWQPALDLATLNVGDAEVGSRVELVRTGIEDFEDGAGFDLIWMPAMFFPEKAIDDVVQRMFTLARPGGEVVIAAFHDPADPLTNALDALMTLRSGGCLLTAADLVERINAAGFEDAREVDRQRSGMRRLVTGRKPG